PVANEIIDRLPNTLRLTSASLVVAMVIGLTAGILSATFRGGWIDRISIVLATIGLSIPGFWLGMMIMLLFRVRLQWFPVFGAETWLHLVMPALTLGLIESAVIARLTRASMLDALNQDYIRTARANGLRDFFVVWRHGLRNALIPIVTILGLEIGGLLSGAFLIQAGFSPSGFGPLPGNTPH